MNLFKFTTFLRLSQLTTIPTATTTTHMITTIQATIKTSHTTIPTTHATLQHRVQQLRYTELIASDVKRISGSGFCPILSGSFSQKLYSRSLILLREKIRSFQDPMQDPTVPLEY